MMNKTFTATTAAAALGVLTILGCSAATADASAAKTPVTAAHLTGFTTDDGPTEQVILSGAVGDFGKGVSVNPDGSVNPEHNSQLELQLQRGTFRLDIASIDKAFVAAMAHQFPSDPATCSGHIDVTQHVAVVKGSGTGAYRGVSGDFTLTLSLDEVDKPTAGQPCDGTQAFVSQTIITAGPGNLRF
ncbi:hypothetical protein [Catenulispora rubra]|uniref:hypothetical protein n=1 Tax=Catenulispora rubra TaxID=280293 RepID=UPI0018924585|nr:hypothetical protein [Catenulispora rubra]